MQENEKIISTETDSKTVESPDSSEKPMEVEASTENDDTEIGEEELREQLLRALADSENIRRRAKKDVQEATQFAISNFARDMLSVADNMNRALSAITKESREQNESMAVIADGIEMTARELESIFERHRITLIDPKGERFDYNLHQAMFEDTNANQADGTIVQVLQYGYMLGDRLLRPAMVGVAKSNPSSEDELETTNKTDDEFTDEEKNLSNNKQDIENKQ